MISPGGLPKGLTLADLGHLSIRRNPLLADLLHRIDFIEKAGTGIRRIRDGARAVDCPEPEFEAGSFVRVTFRPNPEVREVAGDGRVAPEVAGEATPQATPQVAPQVTGQVTPEVTPEVRLLRAMFGETTKQRLQEALDLKSERWRGVGSRPMPWPWTP